MSATASTTTWAKASSASSFSWGKAGRPVVVVEEVSFYAARGANSGRLEEQRR
jgi:hypothetical protein